MARCDARVLVPPMRNTSRRENIQGRTPNPLRMYRDPYDNKEGVRDDHPIGPLSKRPGSPGPAGRSAPLCFIGSEHAIPVPKMVPLPLHSGVGI